MMHPTARIAFYTPTKGLDGSARSGERRIVETTLELLGKAGFDVQIPSRLVTLDRDGDAERQHALMEEAETEAARVAQDLRAEPPALWWSYHSYYKCPDLLGPVVSRALEIPYVLQQPTLNPKHLQGPWAGFAEASLDAHEHATRLMWTTRRDVPALDAAGHSEKLFHLPAVIDPGPMPALHAAHSPLRLLTVAMMPEGPKLESYRRLAAALSHLRLDWHLRIAGDGPARPRVEALFTELNERVTFLGQRAPVEVAEDYSQADLLVWPGVGEGVGMVYLEAQAAGVPVIAEGHPAQRDVVEGSLAPPDDPAAFAGLIEDAAYDRVKRARAARLKIEQQHSPDVVAPILRDTLLGLIA